MWEQNRLLARDIQQRELDQHYTKQQRHYVYRSYLPPIENVNNKKYLYDSNLPRAKMIEQLQVHQGKDDQRP
jgi:hypothetical protein